MIAHAIRRRGRSRWALGLSLLIALGCDASPPVRGLTAAGKVDSLEWNVLFAERRIELRLPDSGQTIRRIAKLEIAPDGHLFVPDSRGKRILRFDRDGQLATEIGGAHEGAVRIGALGGFALDPAGNVFLYDLETSMVTVLDRSTFAVIRQHRIKGPVSDLVALGDGSVVTYYPADAAGVFKRFDPNGKRVAVAHRVRDEKLRLFHGRVHNGGIARDASGDVVGIHPAEFELIQLSPELEVRALLRPDSTDAWAPRPKRFPAGLSPTDYSSAHRQWWDSFLHIGRPFTLAPGLVLVTVFSSNGLSERRDFANLYQTDGRIRARGMQVPHEGHVISAESGKAYVVRNAGADQKDAIRPLELYEYTLRSASLVAAVQRP